MYNRSAMYAEVVVNLPVEGTFHYHIEAELAGRLQVGHLVEVSFGQQMAQGVIVGFDRRAPVEETKPILRLVDREPILNEHQLRLAEWISQAYLAPLAECIRLFIPPGLSRRGDMLFSLRDGVGQIEPCTRTQARLLKLLATRGPLRGRQIARHMPRQDWRAAAGQLVERGILLREPVLAAPAVQPKQVRVVELALPPERVEAAIAMHLDPTDRSERQAATLSRRADILRALARERRSVTVSWIYAAVPGSSLADLRTMAEDDLIILRQEEQFRDPLAGFSFVPDRPPLLTPYQAAAWEVINEALDGPAKSRPILLHGVTGSGKTELYMRAVARVLEQGRSAIVLVPEIALTPQTVRRFGARFPGRMGLVHSQLSPGERYDTWRRARSGLIDLVIGPRSALFTPLRNLGLIVIDECHDDSYKQSPPLGPPHYHTIPVAIELGRLHGAPVILGSATPNVADYAAAVPAGSDQAGRYTLIELPGRIMGHRRAIETQALHYHIHTTRYSHIASDPDEAVMIDLPPVQVVDMREELKAGNRSIFSRALTAALEKTLARGEQAILFLNRRGTATYVFCRECGHVMRCPRCDIPLTWHTDSADESERQTGLLICHHCDQRVSVPVSCPACGSPHIRFFGGGTERVEREVARRFPQAMPLRWDRDTTGGKGAHMALLQQFINRQANVLIGTQMIAKGLDLPLVTLVGVISADTALYLPDYRSGERTFQLLTQVAGRAGRGLLGGQVILQTYAPDHYAIRAAAEHDFHTFFRQEIAYRVQMGYPPASRLARLVIRAEKAWQAEQEAERLRAVLAKRIARERLVNTRLIGPAPCFYPRQGELYCWHLMICGPNPTAALGDLRPSRDLLIDVDPVSLV